MSNDQYEAIFAASMMDELNKLAAPKTGTFQQVEGEQRGLEAEAAKRKAEEKKKAEAARRREQMQNSGQ